MIEESGVSTSSRHGAKRHGGVSSLKLGTDRPHTVVVVVVVVAKLNFVVEIARRHCISVTVGVERLARGNTPKLIKLMKPIKPRRRRRRRRNTRLNAGKG